MTVTWTDALDTVDWNGLSELYRNAPLGNKSPERLETVFGNSMVRRFGYEDGVLVTAGRAKIILYSMPGREGFFVRATGSAA